MPGSGTAETAEPDTSKFALAGLVTKSVVEEGEKRKVAPEGALAPVIEPAEKRASL